MTQFRKILIANRGEIAVRVARTCRAMGIRVVAVYSDADHTALHVRVANEAYRIGPGPARESYLNVDAILSAARESGAEAIHPGYGFLSENADFAERVAGEGLTFIGPLAAAMRAMGDKAEAKRLMEAAGVPVVPGYQEADQTDARLAAEAARIAFPLLIKAAAGGGGRGMREVHEAAHFAEALASARREALAAFADDRVLLERLVVNARHVEVQVFADGQGNTVYLGERDCSVQRRHQKVYEEAPAPAVNAELRRRMGEAAVRAARRAGYTNAGTVEFLLESSGAFYFLEMNTRLQVEHPVTELVTGLDLVRLQIEVAAGGLLRFGQDDVSLRGHAIEARLYAEDPFNNFLPASGRLRRLSLPSGLGVRVDTGFTSGATVSPYYDTMLAKIIVWGADRPEALARLRGALAGTVVVGLPSNLPLLMAVAAAGPFAEGEATTDFLDREWPGLAADRDPPAAALQGAAGFAVTAAPSMGLAVDPWASLGAWRVGPAPRSIRLESAGGGRLLTVTPAGGDRWEIADGDRHDDVSIGRLRADELVLRRAAEVFDLRLGSDEAGRQSVSVDGKAYAVALVETPSPDAAAAAAPGDGAGSGQLTAPMPGLVVRLHVAAGDRVQANQTLALLEAMKIEHAILAPFAGVVSAVHVAEGQRVMGGAVLIEVVPASASGVTSRPASSDE